MYEGNADFMLRVGGSASDNKTNTNVSLISYGLLVDFTLNFMENGQTITGFYNMYKAKCKFKYGMAESEVISMSAWKKAVAIFWTDIIKLDLPQSFICRSCGPLPETLVFDGITLGLQWRKVRKFQEKMQLLMGRKSKRILQGTTYPERMFVQKKENRNILKEAVAKKLWPLETDQEDATDSVGDTEYFPSSNSKISDNGMNRMAAKLDKTSPPCEGLLKLMSNLAASTSTTSLFQVCSSSPASSSPSPLPSSSSCTSWPASSRPLP